jgi:hypothetical protein
LTVSVLPLIATLVSLGLLWTLGAKLFAGKRWGIVAALLFLSTPVIWQQLQNAPASLYPLPWVAGWLVAIAHYQERRSKLALAVAGALLGIGLYTSFAAMVMMPLNVLVTVAVIGYGRREAVRDVAVFVGAFAVTALPLVVSLLLRPDTFRDIVLAARLYDANRFNVLQGIREIVSWVGLTARSDVYYSYFNPAFLFLGGDVLLWPLLVLLPVGLYRIVTCETTILARLLLLGFLTAPFAAALTAVSPTPRRAIVMTPFAIMISVYGVRSVWQWGSRLSPLSSWRSV